jgi:hypothetical protein
MTERALAVYAKRFQGPHQIVVEDSVSVGRSRKRIAVSIEFVGKVDLGEARHPHQPSELAAGV